MTTQDAKNNIGKEFKPMITGTKFDVIRLVVGEMIHGDFTVAKASDCRLKQEQPIHLRKPKKS